MSIDLETRYILGWVLMGLAAFNILVNMGIVLYVTVIYIYKSFKTKRIHKKALNALYRKLDNRKGLINLKVHNFEHF